MSSLSATLPLPPHVATAIPPTMHVMPSAFVPHLVLPLQSASGSSILRSSRSCRPSVRLAPGPSSPSTTPLFPSRTVLSTEMALQRRSAVTTTTSNPSPRSTAMTSSSPSSSSSVLNRWPGDAPSRVVQVVIERPQKNRRVVNAANLINAPLECVWDLLSDYDHLADHIPNLVESRLCLHPKGGIRLAQCGAQRILGFQFRAALTMDMTEKDKESEHARAIEFDLVASKDFKQFQGEWTMVRLEQNKTALFYSVDIIPKGLVPVTAIEWRIAEDVPQNMDAVRLECERRRRMAIAAANSRSQQQQ